MNNVVIRPCQPGDEAALALVGQATFLDAFAGILPARDIVLHCTRQHSVEKYAGYLNDAASAVWVAEVEPGHAPVGYVVLTTPDLPLADLAPEDVEIKRIYILKRFQGGGLGARLMREAEALARARKFRRLLLGVYSRNTAAIGFYEKLGYRKIGERPFKVGENTYHDFILGMNLSSL
jgi:ribosomal protein S18 acetylase RimI-like enzyme